MNAAFTVMSWMTIAFLAMVLWFCVSEIMRLK